MTRPTLVLLTATVAALSAAPDTVLAAPGGEVRAYPGTETPTRSVPRRIALVPPIAVEQVPAAQLARWQRAISEALTHEGVTVFEQQCSPGRAQPLEELAACAVAHDVPAVVSMRAHRPLAQLDEAKLGGLTLAWYDRDNVLLSEAHVLDDRPLNAQAKALVQRLLDRVRAATGPWLIVQSKPEGATLIVDGARMAGRTPMILRATGETQLRAQLGELAADGLYRAPQSPDGSRAITLTLRPAEQVPSPAAAAATLDPASGAPPPAARAISLTERWWFWPTVGVVTAAAATTLALSLWASDPSASTTANPSTLDLQR